MFGWAGACRTMRRIALLRRNEHVRNVLGHRRRDLYLVLLCTLAVLSFRKGHWVLGLIGFIFPVLWLFGAILPARRHR